MMTISQQDICRLVKSKIMFNDQSRSQYITTLLKKLLKVGEKYTQ